MDSLFTPTYRDILKLILEYAFIVNPKKIIFINKTCYNLGRELLKNQDILIYSETFDKIPDFFHISVHIYFQDLMIQNDPLNNLRILKINYMPSRQLHINSNSLIELNISNSNIQYIFGEFPRLKKLNVEFSDLLAIPENLIKLDYLNISTSQLRDTGNLIEVNNLNIRHNYEDLKFSNLQVIQELYSNQYYQVIEHIKVQHLIFDTNFSTDFSKYPIKKITVISNNPWAEFLIHPETKLEIKN